MLRVIKGYTHTALTVPCCQREAAVFRRQKEETASERLAQQQLYLILGQRERGKQRERQAGDKAEGEEEAMIGGGKPWYNSRLINEEAVRWNEQEIEESAKAGSCLWSFAPARLCTLRAAASTVTHACFRSHKTERRWSCVTAAKLPCQNHRRKKEFDGWQSTDTALYG